MIRIYSGDKKNSMVIGVSLCLICILYGSSWRSFIYILSNAVRERPSFRRGLFRTPSDRISHHIHILRTSCCQLPVRSGIVWLLVEVVYWLRVVKPVYPTINLVFLELIVKVKVSAKFCLHSFKWFCLQISDAKYFFPFLSKVLLSRIDSCNNILFSNLKQKRTHY